MTAAGVGGAGGPGGGERGAADGGWDGVVASAVKAVVDANQWRRPRDLDGPGPAAVESSTGREVLSFASNDYLGLTLHPAVRAAAAEAARACGAGSGSARLIVGSRPVHTELEARIAAWRGVEAAVLFTTGYAANLGVVATLGRWASLICSDELNHASIIDGCKLARAPTRVYPHCDAAAVDGLLEGSDGRGVVVSDTVFSMDGDLAPVAELSEVCAARGALLVLDDAHAVLDHPEAVHPECRVLRVGTLSKAVGALGGYVCGLRPYVDLLVNKARSYIFTTALAPAPAAAALAAIEVIDSPEGAELKARLRANVDRVRPGHPSPIIPVVLGDEAAAIAASDALAAAGILVPAIRPPTVPVGTSRLRVAVSAAHTAADLDRLLDALDRAGISPGGAAGAAAAGAAPGAERRKRGASAARTDRRERGAAPGAGRSRRAGVAETVVFFTGTGTEIGKTWAAAGLARALRRRGLAVRACKPVQSHDPAEAAPTDAEVLAAATGQSPDEVCPPERTYPVPLAPPMAAAKLGRPCPGLDELARMCRGGAGDSNADGVSAEAAAGEAPGGGVSIVEGAGGLFSPLGADGDNLGLIERLDPDWVVVAAPAGLGAVHSVVACTAALAGRRPLVFLNRFNPAAEVHTLNLEWLVEVEGLEAVTSVEALAERI